MDSGAKMIVGRVRDDGEYVRVRADMGPTADDLRALEPLTDAEKMRVVLQVRLELSRLGVGYSNLEEAQSQFYIFKRIPISENLTEDTFIANLDAVEAAVHAVNIVFHLAVQRSNAQELVGQPGSASYAPTPALPAASS